MIVEFLRNTHFSSGNHTLALLPKALWVHVNESTSGKHNFFLSDFLLFHSAYMEMCACCCSDLDMSPGGRHFSVCACACATYIPVLCQSTSVTAWIILSKHRELKPQQQESSCTYTHVALVMALQIIWKLRIFCDPTSPWTETKGPLWPQKYLWCRFYMTIKGSLFEYNLNQELA